MGIMVGSSLSEKWSEKCGNTLYGGMVAVVQGWLWIIRVVRGNVSRRDYLRLCNYLTSRL